jgi:hypothetical protein
MHTPNEKENLKSCPPVPTRFKTFFKGNQDLIWIHKREKRTIREYSSTYQTLCLDKKMVTITNLVM